MKSNNNRYDDEFKTSAVKLVTEKGRSISTVAKDLGISEPALRRWIKANTEPVRTSKVSELEAEIKRLKKELEDTQDTVKILKKSVAIFIKP